MEAIRPWKVWETSSHLRCVDRLGSLSYYFIAGATPGKV